MADLSKLYENYGTEKTMQLLAQADELAKNDAEIGWGILQSELKIGTESAYMIMDWLADNNRATWKISNHWIRAGRRYVLNNPIPSLADMCVRLRVGEKRGYLIMQELVRRGLIDVNAEFHFVRKRKMHTFKDMIRQVKLVAKRYRGRCEFQLLERLLYIDPVSAFRLAQYAEEHLGLYWKKKNDWIR